MDGHDVIERLHAYGRAPLPPEARDHVLARLADRTGARRRLRWRVAVGGVAALLVGSGGLATAGALPAPVQDVAHRALQAVGVNVPPGHERYNDPVDCPGGPYANHGDYVSKHPDDPTAGRSPCGKPTKAVRGESGSPGHSGSAPGKTKDKAESDDETDETDEPETTATTESTATTETTVTTESTDTTDTTVTDTTDTTDTTEDLGGS